MSWSQAAASASVCMQNMSLPRRNALEVSIYYLMAKHFGSTKTSEVQLATHAGTNSMLIYGPGKRTCKGEESV